MTPGCKGRMAAAAAAAAAVAALQLINPQTNTQMILLISHYSARFN